ncbi:hypothetical protein BRYFOR_06908 [Marvinbryantia formatexigens DSM 14469]|uniref:Uncharacterized protein n=1 Tax=Marvinbryantia formatexigens DSM 14469 TaxID=478749 RepID=C6LE59_9FIRM|nr:hypothetical protein BRYFOR_06908 [Marvinbryantia formatexigens DSM 14469]
MRAYPAEGFQRASGNRIFRAPARKIPAEEPHILSKTIMTWNRISVKLPEQKSAVPGKRKTAIYVSEKRIHDKNIDL